MRVVKTLREHLSLARKQYFANQNAVEKWKRKRKREPHEVSVYYKICKYLPFEVTNKRVRGWRHERILPDGGKITTKADETITPGDIFVLIAAIKVFQDYKDKIVTGTDTNDLSTAVLSVVINYTEFAKKYIRSHDKAKLLLTLERLFSYHAFWHDADGSVTTQRYLYNFSLDAGQKNLTLTISKGFAELCDDYGWLVNFEQIQKITSPTARALFLYFSSNSGSDFNQETLEGWLDMKNDNSKQRCKNRDTIKNALIELTPIFLKTFTFNAGEKCHIEKIKIEDKKDSPPQGEASPLKGEICVISPLRGEKRSPAGGNPFQKPSSQSAETLG